MASETKPIHRSKLLTHPLGGGQAGVLRESGLIDNERGMYDAWSRGLTVHRVLNYRTKGKSPVELTNLIYDQILHSAILGFKTIGGGSGPNDKARVCIVREDGLGKPSPPFQAFRARTSLISSLSLSSSRILLVLGQNSSAGFVCTVDVPRDVDNVWDVQSLDGGLKPFSRSYWASAANPFSQATSFAIAASCGAIILNESQSGNQSWWKREFGERFLHPDTPAVMSVDWLSPHVVIKGCIDGGVRLWDIRSRGESRESRIQHPSQINHARRVDENTIVVAGLESQLCTYDLRFESDLATHGQVTRPFHRFPSYENVDLGHLATGFDVHGDLVAAVTDDGRIIIWDVKRGFELKQVRLGSAKPTGDAICVRFVDRGSVGKGLTLMAAAGVTIDEFAW